MRRLRTRARWPSSSPKLRDRELRTDSRALAELVCTYIDSFVTFFCVSHPPCPSRRTLHFNESSYYPFSGHSEGFGPRWRLSISLHSPYYNYCAFANQPATRGSIPLHCHHRPFVPFPPTSPPLRRIGGGPSRRVGPAFLTYSHIGPLTHPV
jgi:hypothetical protein